MTKSRLISLGVITSAHGIRGQVKIRSFTASPSDITKYGSLTDASGKEYILTVTGGTKDALIATVEGINSRNDAEALAGTELFVPREALPKTKKNEYYHEDLIGLKVVTKDGALYGTVTGMHNFGAGDLIALKKEDGEEEFLPFTQAIFTTIDPEKGVLIIVPPEIKKD
jgi:16S rRNA processing protein RimM